ncbi:hypothetical protein AB7M42_007626 [Bradyrhizobium diazoefficiens]|nr:hypothetical protein [Bradyrhizobium japonicum]MCS3899417.1 hypothetical protein [Bradyrhizobium japonicum USDA 38]MCS3942471.1 hypothetical protein [Bradyrhizobium japonicum]MCS3980614.1 hypothetical protein [Bradyrhizobium japonicum]
MSGRDRDNNYNKQNDSDQVTAGFRGLHGARGCLRR